MSTTTNPADQQWLNLISECRASGLTDRQWCLQNGIPTSTFYYHVRQLRRKACIVHEAQEHTVEQQDVVQIPLWEAVPEIPVKAAAAMPPICLEMQGIRIEIQEHAGEEIIRNTLRVLRSLC